MSFFDIALRALLSTWIARTTPLSRWGRSSTPLDRTVPHMLSGTWAMPMTWSPRQAPYPAFNAKPTSFRRSAFGVRRSTFGVRRSPLEVFSVSQGGRGEGCRLEHRAGGNSGRAEGSACVASVVLRGGASEGRLGGGALRPGVRGCDEGGERHPFGGCFVIGGAWCRAKGRCWWVGECLPGGPT